jgi:hypothetical protein
VTEIFVLYFSPKLGDTVQPTREEGPIVAHEKSVSPDSFFAVTSYYY